MWVLADVVGLFSINVGPFSRNLGSDHRIFSANVVPNRRMLLGPAIYVCGPLHVALRPHLTRPTLCSLGSKALSVIRRPR
jgi:hypothetical protein